MSNAQRQLSKKQLFRRVLAVIIFFVALAAALMFIKKWDAQHGLFQGTEESTTTTQMVETLPEDERMKIRYKDQWYVMRDNLETVLLIGLDKFEYDELNNSYNNDRQSDFLMLGILDHANKTVSAIHINRDTMCDVPVLSVLGEIVDTKYEQLALSFTYGSGGHDSCRNTVRAVSSLLYDLPIDHYIAATMDAVPILNDSVNGVKVTIRDDMTAVNPAWKKGVTVKLTGEEALTYVRARKTLADSSNVTRMRRQRQYLVTLYKKAKVVSQRDGNYLANTSLQLADSIATDYSLGYLQDMANAAATYEWGGMYIIPGEAKAGDKYIEFYPKESSLQSLLVRLLFEPETSS